MLTKNQIANILQFIARELSGENENTVSTETATPSGDTPAPKRRGRPAANSAPAPATTVAPETQQATAEPEKTPDPKPEEKKKVEGAMTYQDLQVLIQPLIKQVRGLEVKAVLNKYAPPDFKVDENNWYTLQALSEHPEHHAAFVADIEALKM
jgi:hypothetical protein